MSRSLTRHANSCTVDVRVPVLVESSGVAATVPGVTITASDDAEHLADLLAALPWQVKSDRRGVYLSDEDSSLNEAIRNQNDDRWAMLRNGQRDFHPLLEGERNDSGIFRAVMYAFVVFDSPSSEITREVGRLVRIEIGVNEADMDSVGRRWIEDLCATAYRLLLRHNAKDRRLQFTG